ncbi:3-isopropylmalate dehydratase small subunit [Polynucleobacter sp. SHI8]|uniref:LeuD/DmdB family oxidoreductase small subunit n=1 Tax=unclassified Polynucleobacter TaxID=2640945 RepID=UPI002491B891|nr:MULTISPECIES: 3-isopropylmalate dehydratase [unclassified Polynucleobacter]BDW11712.1 3-isopropylmalate dehydratase small subunit [Polynucleobacter sp. SHI2]BDW14159.1 3-isopropylmalate dehydratase small subunit [Polynucleobacter sp. SHI8]
MSNMLIEGKTFLLGEEVNTDINCSSKYLPGKDSEYVSTVAFEKLEPGFAQGVIANGGGILVAGKNFGINSSREQAIHVLHLMKVKCILAPSFGRQFFRNAINNGLPIIECDTAQIQAGENLQVDLQLGKVISNSYEINFTPLPQEILKIIQMGGLLNFITKHPDWNFAA